MAPKDYDFCGWVTKNDLECSDGRTIRRDAFAHQDGAKVPMVWMHNHESPEAVIGYTILENRPEGVYGYSYCNNTEMGNHAKEMVRHGDIDSYSIYANRLKEQSANVVHGFIREVSLVLNGANEGARIQDVSFGHSDEAGAFEAIIVTGDSNMELHHSESEGLTDEEILDTLDGLTEEQQTALAYVICAAQQQAVDEYEASLMSEEDDDEEDAESEEEIEDSVEDEEDFEEYSDEDSEEDEYEYEVSHSGEEGENDMKSNVFDNETYSEGGYLSHADVEMIFSEAKKGRGTLGEMYEDVCEGLSLSHAEEDPTHGVVRAEDKQAYGVNDPSFLFPDAHNLNVTPEFIKRDMDWVSEVMNGTKHTPFSRIKSQFADITADEARAKGYIKGNKKEEEVFTLLRRTTTPQTVYKLQKFDRDDVIDITDFDVVAWIKGEMRMMLNEEIARAALVGDGRSAASKDHISGDHIRPVWGDDSLFTIYKDVTVGSTAADTAKDFIVSAIRARKQYKGSGSPVLFTTEDWLTEMLLLEDKMGHALYKTEAELATKMRVRKIVTVPVMESLAPKNNKIAIGIILNLADYTFGADKGGAISLFDDFDINFNKYEYLIETRCSGALTKPYSAICLEIPASVQTTAVNGEG